jgi:hypothetical protein
MKRGNRYVQTLYDLGVCGFQLDAAKHMPNGTIRHFVPDDVANIVTWDYTGLEPPTLGITRTAQIVIITGINSRREISVMKESRSQNPEVRSQKGTGF